ncbi:hypothetical protein DV451_000186 [Geotrichum candidum]|uniref:DOA4-independent degradation protein 4 n=1 Tax=Geotrichum candidum TaxID=1173061 RepID=A0A9P5KY38_GEOCN|nr:hypothetical protein DV451_000186 [Geotrichum candidum]KAI9212444.1 hypothetical protein DS838_002651 [Geotrichum bryndzae]KAF5105695.1 hypothetical protein DV453_004592 [Geotrichum candidum]KAF5112758.1 hypothetical protein DV454_004016 [Geotrichum candidum]KAF5135478.1 hypothetical protein DV495_000699 [Geotrichum candidum]
MQVLEWAFGKRLTPQERLRKERKLIQDIKKSAKQGQTGACQVMAKDLVRTRRYIQKFYQMKTQLQAVSLRIQTVGTNQQMMMSMRGATRLLGTMNRSMNLPSLQRIAMEFERENDIMDQRQEMMDDAIDDTMLEGEDDEEESQEILNQVFDEIGIDLNQALGNTPAGIAAQPAKEGDRVAQAVGGAGEDDLQARLDSLKR